MIASEKKIPTLIGFRNNYTDEKGSFHNFILSNGTRSDQTDKGIDYYDHMIPKDALKKIRSVTIYYDNVYIDGFSFFDKDGALLWMIGETYSGLR